MTNAEVRCFGRRYFIDIAFPDHKLAIEIDGRIHQQDRTMFESDRRRQNHLVLQGWWVLRFTWEMLSSEPDEFIETVHDAMRTIELGCGLSGKKPDA